MSTVHIAGWVEVIEPSGGGGRPDNSLPGGRPDRPDNSLPGGGHISTGPIYGGGHPGNKPPGRPIIPAYPGNKPPMGGAPPHPWTPGWWEIIDPGWGKPPQIGFFPVDPGFGMPEGGAPDVPSAGLPTPPGRPPQVGGGPATPPAHIGGGPIRLPGGIWVPTDPDFGIEARPCPGGKPHPPLWAWIPDPPDLTKPVEPTEPPTAAPK